MWRCKPRDLNLESLLKAAGAPISGAGTHTLVYKLKIEGEFFFLKVSKPESWQKLIPRLCMAQAWCSSMELEGRNLQWLAKQGLATIDVDTVASRYRFGIPVAGFMLTQAHPGIGLDVILRNEPAAQCREWMEAYGQLSGRLHQLGAYEPLRAKDILVDKEKLVLLDREKPPIRPGWRQKRAYKTLERVRYRNQRAGIFLEEGLARDFARGYERSCPQADLDQVKARLTRHQE